MKGSLDEEHSQCKPLSMKSFLDEGLLGEGLAQ